MSKKLLKQQINEALVDMRKALPAEKKQLAERLCRLFGEWRRLCSSEFREADVAKGQARAAVELLRSTEAKRVKIAQQLEHLRKQAKADRKRVRHLEGLLKRANGLVTPSRHNLTGLDGCVFEFEGRVTGAIPPIETKGAIRFGVGTVRPATSGLPEFVVIAVEHICVLMNPDICKPPFHRMFDCIALAWQELDRLVEIANGECGCIVEIPGERYYFFAEATTENIVVMVDTEERFNSYVTGKHA